MTIFPTAREAINHSLHHGHLAYCRDTPENRTLLQEECEHHGTTDYWADGPPGYDQDWRVRVV